MLGYKITDKNKFVQIDDIDLSGAGNSIWKNAFDGTVYIELTNGESITSDGQHHIEDWKDEYGFVVIEQ